MPERKKDAAVSSVVTETVPIDGGTTIGAPLSPRSRTWMPLTAQLLSPQTVIVLVVPVAVKTPVSVPPQVQPSPRIFM